MATISLSRIIHPASESEIKDKHLVASRYWLTDDGELLRQNRLFGKSRCFVVTCIEADDHSIVRLPFRAIIPCEGTSLFANIGGNVDISCSATGVHKLVMAWTAKESAGPDAAFESFFQHEISRLAEESDVSTLSTWDGYLQGGNLRDLVAREVMNKWGLSVSLRVDRPGQDIAVRKELKLQTEVRLRDKQPLSVTPVFELSKTTSVLRAAAALGHEATIVSHLIEVVREYYSTAVDLEHVLGASYLPRRAALEQQLQRSGELYGHSGRLIDLGEAPPSMPGGVNEMVFIDLPPRVLLDESEPVKMELTLRLERRDSAKMLERMASLPGTSLLDAVSGLIESKLVSAMNTWSGATLRSSGRTELLVDLSDRFRPIIATFGYDLRNTDLKTSIDKVAAATTETLELDRSLYLTADSRIAVDIGIRAHLKFLPGARQRKSLRELLEPYRTKAIESVKVTISRCKPSEIYLGWHRPYNSRPSSLQGELRAILEEHFKSLAEEIDLTITLFEQAELVERQHRILNTPINIKGIALNPDNIPGEIKVSVHANVVSLNEEAWERMSTRVDTDGVWMPVLETQNDIPRLLEESFRKIVEFETGILPSRLEAITKLQDELAREVRELHHIEIKPHISLHAAPMVVSFYEGELEGRRQDLDYYFQEQRAIRESIQARKLERIHLLGTSADAVSLRENEAAKNALLAEAERTKQANREVNEQFRKANYYYQLLSVPSDGLEDKGLGLDKAFKPAEANASKALSLPNPEEPSS